MIPHYFQQCISDPTESANLLNDDHPTVFFNEPPTAHTPYQKHLEMHLDQKLNFNTHINEKIAKANTGTGIIHKPACVLPRESLIIMYKLFGGTNIDYGHIIYDQPNNDSFCNMIERVQYNAALVMRNFSVEIFQRTWF